MKPKQYYISVGEPWDFNSPDGQNVINGIIIKILSATCLIFRANYILDFKGHLGDIFILYPRYSKSDFAGLENETNYVAINGNLLVGGFNESMTEEELKDRSAFVLIGSIRI
jgi:hypothetical protein